MKRNEIISKIESIKPGTFVRISYRTEVPVKAADKKAGIKMWKEVSTTVRTGVNYGKIASVIARKAQEDASVEKRAYTNPYEWVIQDRVKVHTGSGKEYFYFASVNGGHNTKTHYFYEGPVIGVIDMGSSIDEKLASVVLPSYFNKKGNASEVRQVAFDNIISIG